MLLNGISIKGSYHNKNQDCYASRNIGNAYIVVVSDGLGSKELSELGSEALCQSACDILSEFREEIDDMSPELFTRLVHEKWLYKLRGRRVSDCYATMLIFLVLSEKIIAVRLGDGFVAFWADDEVRILFDQKEDYFANETDCLTENLVEEKIQCIEVPYRKFNGGILCSDGVGIGNMTENEIKRFTIDFIEEYRTYTEEELLKAIEDWLKDWPGADDKTLAFALMEER